MRPFKTLISMDEALAICMKTVRPVTTVESLRIDEASGRVAGSDVFAEIPVPLTDRAAMDGYAVKASDTYGAGRFRPRILRRIERLYAGSSPRKRVSEGTCIEVATGSTIPKGANAVVIVEDTESTEDKVSVYSPVHPGENISSKGEDLKEGDRVVSKGEVLTPAKIGALAAVGSRKVKVYRRPTVAVLTTGDEVIEPGEPIHPGLVYDINAYTLSTIVQENGGEPRRLMNVPDKVKALRRVLRAASAYDLVVFSGGSSVGEKDLIIDVLSELGRLEFHGVAVKPGKPTVFGLVGKTPVLGMPGYPTSCLSNAYIILAPILRKMARLPPRHKNVITIPISRRLVSTIGRVEFHTVKIENGKAVPVYKESGAITSMANADGYVMIPSNVDLIEKGEMVQVILF